MAGFRFGAAGMALRDVAWGSAWFPSIVFGAHVVASRGFDAYEWFPPLDVPMHVLGGVAIAFFIAGAVASAERHHLVEPLETIVRTLLVLALVTSATVFWEFAEWVADHTIGTHAQKGLDDTLFDMLCGIIGGAVFVVLHANWIVRKRRAAL
jgi:hypothetical protein